MRATLLHAAGDVRVEAVGTQATYLQAVGAVRRGGVISRVGVPQYEDAPAGWDRVFRHNIRLADGPAPTCSRGSGGRVHRLEDDAGHRARVGDHRQVRRLDLGNVGVGPLGHGELLSRRDHHRAGPLPCPGSAKSPSPDAHGAHRAPPAMAVRSRTHAGRAENQ